MYTVKSEVRVILEKDDIMKLINDAIDDDAFYILGNELPENYEGEFKAIRWTKEGEIEVTME